LRAFQQYQEHDQGVHSFKDLTITNKMNKTKQTTSFKGFNLRTMQGRHEPISKWYQWPCLGGDWLLKEVWRWNQAQDAATWYNLQHGKIGRPEFKTSTSIQTKIGQGIKRL